MENIVPESAPENTSVAERINERIDTMPAGERAAAQTLIANYRILGLKTVAEFSAQAGVSSPTILRFVNRLGFQNYPEFQAHLQNELAAQLQSPHHRNENPDKAPDTAYIGCEARAAHFFIDLIDQLAVLHYIQEARIRTGIHAYN